MLRRPSQDEQPHQAIVAAYANLQHRLQIDVIIWVPNEGMGTSKEGAAGELKVAASYIGPADEAPTGDVAVTLGDFMGDGTLQIISAADAAAGTGAGRIRLAAYRYASDGTTHTLKRVGTSYALDVANGRSTSLALASADFVGRGHEQFIMSYLVPQDAGADQMALAYFDPATLEQIGPPRAKTTIGPVAKNTYVDMATGLFKFDPKATPVPSDPFFRRQTGDRSYLARCAGDGPRPAGARWRSTGHPGRPGGTAFVGPIAGCHHGAGPLGGRGELHRFQE